MTMTTSALIRESIKDPNDGRRVRYWRYSHADGRHAGAVAPKASGRFRTLAYGDSAPSDNTELGDFPTRTAAEAALAAFYGVGLP